MLLACMTLLLTACGTEITEVPSKELPIRYMNASYAIDIENPKEVVGFGDYVFVAKINEEIETEYRDVVEFKGKTIATPYTVYSVTVIDNLKGKIKRNTPIEFEKFGGINMDNKSISLLDGDELLEEGKYYILVASAESNGKLTQISPTSAIKLDGESKDEIIFSEEYKAFKEFCKEEIKFERQRFISKYEEG